MRRAGDVSFFHQLKANQSSNTILNGLLDTDRAAALEEHQPSDKLPAEWVLLKLARKNESLAEVTIRFREDLEEIKRPNLSQDLNFDDLKLSFVEFNLPLSHKDSKSSSLIKALINCIDLARDENFDILKNASSMYSSFYQQYHPDPKTRNAKIILDQIKEALSLPAAHYFLAVLYQEGHIVEKQDNILAIKHYLICLSIERSKELEGYQPLFSSACEDALLVMRKISGITTIGENTTLLADKKDQRYLWELARWCKHPAALNEMLIMGSSLADNKNPDMNKVQNCFASVYYFSGPPVSTHNGYALEKCFLRSSDISLNDWKKLLSAVHDKAQLKLLELIFSADTAIALECLTTLIQPIGLWSETQNLFMWYLLDHNFEQVIDFIQTEKNRLITLGIYNNMLQAIFQYNNSLLSTSKFCSAIRQELIEEATELNAKADNSKIPIDMQSTVFKYDTIIIMIWMDIAENKNYTQMSGFNYLKAFVEKILNRIPNAMEKYHNMKQLRIDLRNKNASSSLKVKAPASFSL